MGSVWSTTAPRLLKSETRRIFLTWGTVKIVETKGSRCLPSTRRHMCCVGLMVSGSFLNSNRNVSTFPARWLSRRLKLKELQQFLLLAESPRSRLRSTQRKAVAHRQIHLIACISCLVSNNLYFLMDCLRGSVQQGICSVYPGIRFCMLRLSNYQTILILCTFDGMAFIARVVECCEQNLIRSITSKFLETS